MNVECVKEGKNLIVHFNGELDHHIAEEVRDKIDSCYSRWNMNNVIFDFTNVKFMDSSGIGVIMGRYRKADIKGGKVAVVNVISQLDRIFEMSGIYRIVDKYEHLNDAISNM